MIFITTRVLLFPKSRYDRNHEHEIPRLCPIVRRIVRIIAVLIDGLKANELVISNPNSEIK
jgi:hypothetical protein